MITKLTREQKSKLKVYRDRYVQKGLSTKPFSLAHAKQVMDEFYPKVLKREPVKIIIQPNPIRAYLFLWYYKLFKKILRNKYKGNIKKTNEVVNEVRNEVWNEVYVTY